MTSKSIVRELVDVVLAEDAAFDVSYAHLSAAQHLNLAKDHMAQADATKKMASSGMPGHKSGHYRGLLVFI
jgi:hypothetical protein